MKRTRLLNRELSHLVASLGHLDEIVIADAGLPVPAGVMVIDLAVQPGVPSFWDVADALRTELVIEGAVFASEAAPDLQVRLQELSADWGAETGKTVACSAVSHDAFKARSAAARAVIRTGEVTPYCNLVLISGVPF